MSQKPVILQTRTLAQTGLFHIEQVDLRFSNGTQTRFERLRGSSHGAVLIVPLLDEDTVLLIREYAVGTERYELALPKGRIEAEEPLLEAANRELREEVGHAAGELQHLNTISLAPGYSSHMTHVVLARGLYPAPLPGDEPEPLEVVPWRLSELAELLARDDFSEGRSIAALFLTREYLAHG